MPVNWQELLTTVGSGGVLLGAAAWLVKAVLTDKLSRDADAFKARLKTDADVEIERLKNSLQMMALEHQVRFSKLHEQRAGVIAELYKRLVMDVFWAGQSFYFTGVHQPDPREEFNKTLENFRQFTIFVETHRIYLPDNICTLLDKFVDNVRKTVVPIGVWGTMPFQSVETREKWGAAIINAVKKFEEDIPAARRALEDEFRAILGDPPDRHQDNPAKD